MSITQIIRGDSTGAVRAVQEFNRALDKTEENLKETKREAKSLDLAARRIAEAADPQKKYNRQMEELARLVRSGRLEIADAEKQALKYQEALKKAGKSGDDAFGGPMISRIAAMGGGILSAAALVGGLTKAFQEADEAAKNAANSAFAALGAQGELQQLTDDPKKLASINAFAKDLVRRGVFSPNERAQAFETAFELESAGYTDADKEMFANIGERGLVKPSGLVNLGGYVRKAQRTFGLGEDTTAEVLDKLVQTSASAQAGLTETSKAIPEFGSQAKAAGLSFDEALAGFLSIEKRSPGPEEAATRFKNLLGQARDKGFMVNGDLTDTMQSLNARIASGERDSDMFTEIRAWTGFANLREAGNEIGDFEKVVAGARGLADARSGLLEEVDPIYAAGKLRQRAEGSLAATTEELYGEKQLLFDALLARRQEVTTEGMGGAYAALDASIQRLYDVMGAEEKLIQSAATNQAGYYTPEQQKAAEDYLRRTAEGIESLNNRRSEPRGRRE